eukprot:gene6758-8381_t
MATKVFVKLMFSAGSVLARSFVMAYKQALIKAETGGVAGAIDAMSAIEAKKILGFENLEKEITIEDVNSKHDTLMKINDPVDGGSFFLQKKILGAKLTLEAELKSALFDYELLYSIPTT